MDTRVAVGAMPSVPMPLVVGGDDACRDVAVEVVVPARTRTPEGDSVVPIVITKREVADAAHEVGVCVVIADDADGAGACAIGTAAASTAPSPARPS